MVDAMTDVDTTDPFALLQQTADKQEAEARLAENVGNAKKRLVLQKGADAAFWATLVLKMQHKPDWNIETACTDGKDLWVNPGWFQGLSEQERVGVLAHEMSHICSSHHTRRGHRDQEQWNIAGDLVVNPLLEGGGVKLPGNRPMPGEGKYKEIPKGLSTEETYEKLKQKKGQQKDKQQGKGGGGASQGQQEPGEGESEGQGKGQGQRDPGGCGGVQEPGNGSPAELQQAEAEAKVSIAQARNAAKLRGTMSAGLQRWIEEQLEPVVDWGEVLREFVSVQARNDYAWTPPNRRFIHMGIYLPGMRSEELGDVLLAVDTSGSIGEKELSVFAAEMQSILDIFPGAALTILYHDTTVCHVQQWRASDGPLVLEPKGGGGTSHHCVFDWIAQHSESPTCLICLTDMYSSFPSKGPEYPVLWASTTKDKKAPFGQYVEVLVP